MSQVASRQNTEETLLELYRMFVGQKRYHEAEDILKDARALGYEEAARAMDQESWNKK